LAHNQAHDDEDDDDADEVRPHPSHYSVLFVLKSPQIIITNNNNKNNK
jgi:hypothetical protein